MRAVAFVPARGGSKRVPGKNLREVGGVSLVRRAVNAAHGAGIGAWVSSDDWAIFESAAGWLINEQVIDRVTAHGLASGLTPPDIKDGSPAWETSRLFGMHQRPPQLASDHAQIEAAIAHWWTRLDDKPDAIVLLQPTSPFRTAAHVREALRLLEATGADSVVGVTVGHEHHFAGRLKPREGTCWSTSLAQPCPFHDGPVTNVHQPDCGLFKHWFDWQPFRDPSSDRPRTQDLAPRGHENGSIYCVRREFWEKTGNRLGGSMVALPMDRWEGMDIDEESDLIAANAIAQVRGW